MFYVFLIYFKLFYFCYLRPLVTKAIVHSQIRCSFMIRSYGSLIYKKKKCHKNKTQNLEPEEQKLIEKTLFFRKVGSVNLTFYNPLFNVSKQQLVTLGNFKKIFAFASICQNLMLNIRVFVTLVTYKKLEIQMSTKSLD